MPSEWSSYIEWFQLLIEDPDLVLIDSLMNTLPVMTMKGKRFAFRRRDAGKHAHLDDNLSLASRNDGLDRAIRISIRVLKALQGSHLLSTSAAEEPTKRFSAHGPLIHKLLEGAISVFDCHLILIDDQIACDVASGNLPAICTVTEVATALCKKLFVMDRYVYASAKTMAGNSFCEFYDGMLIRITGKLRHGIS